MRPEDLPLLKPWLDEMTIERVLDFLPYPFLLSEWNAGEQRNLFLNRKFQAEIGYTLEEIPSISDWFRHAYPEIEYQNEIIRRWEIKSARAVKLGRDSVLMKARIRTKKNGSQWYQVKASISGPVQLVAFINIDNEMMRKEELQRQNENHNQALSILAHDLRGPLNNLIAIMRLADQQQISQGEYQHSVNAISSNLFKVMEFFDTTLQWTRSNFSRINTAFELIDLHAIITDILQLYKKQYTDKKLNIELDVAHLQNVWSDPEIVSITCRNIISNAIKFTSEQGAIRISAERKHGNVIITCSDTGIGMTSERIDMIVNHNYSPSKGTSGEKGLGMGLRLCNQLLFKIGGKLEIESAINHGTSIRMIL